MKSLISMLLWGVIWVYALIGIVGLLCVCVVTGPFAVIIVVIQLGLGAFGWAMSHRRGRGGAGFLLGFAL